MDCNLPSFSVSVSAIFRRLLKNEQAATWLLSNEQAPPTCITSQLLKGAMIGEMAMMTQYEAEGLWEHVESDSSDGSFLHDPYNTPGTTLFRHLATRTADNLQPAQQVTRMKPFVHAGNRTILTSIETIATVCHSIQGNYAFATVADTRSPFAFLEPPSDTLPGVKRLYVELTDDDTFAATHFWSSDGRASLVCLTYPHDLSKPARKCLMLLRPYPSSRYPCPADILDIGWNASRYQCQYCLLRGLSDCGCPPSVVERTWPRLPPKSRRDPWKMIVFFYALFESGYKKQKIDLYNVARKIGASAKLIYHINPIFVSDNPVDHVRGYNKYLKVIEPVYTKIMLNWRAYKHRSVQVQKITAPTDLQNAAANDHRQMESRPQDPHERDQAHLLDIEDILEGYDFAPFGFSSENEGIQALQADIWPAPPFMDANLVILPNVSHVLPAGTGETTKQQGAATHIAHSKRRRDIGGAIATESPHKRLKAESSSEPKQSPGNEEDEVDPVANQTAETYLEEVENTDVVTDCKLCNKKFSRKYDLKRHIKTAHLDMREFECEVAGCGYKAKRKQHLAVHHSLVHDKESVQMACEHCGKVLISEFSKKRHIRLVHKLDPVTGNALDLG